MVRPQNLLTKKYHTYGVLCTMQDNCLVSVLPHLHSDMHVTNYDHHHHHHNSVCSFPALFHSVLFSSMLDVEISSFLFLIYSWKLKQAQKSLRWTLHQGCYTSGCGRVHMSSHANYRDFFRFRSNNDTAEDTT